MNTAALREWVQAWRAYCPSGAEGRTWRREARRRHLRGAVHIFNALPRYPGTELAYEEQVVRTFKRALRDAGVRLPTMSELLPLLAAR